MFEKIKEFFTLIFKKDIIREKDNNQKINDIIKELNESDKLKKIKKTHFKNFNINIFSKTFSERKKIYRILILDDFNYITDTIFKIVKEHLEKEKLNYEIYVGNGQNVIYEVMFNEKYCDLRYDIIFTDIIFGGLYVTTENEIITLSGIDFVKYCKEKNKKINFKFITGCVLSKYSDENKQFLKEFKDDILKYTIFKTDEKLYEKIKNFLKETITKIEKLELRGEQND